MSKLADAIRRSQRVESAPMGFGAARLAAKPSMLVGFFGPAANLAGAIEAGAELAVLDARDKALTGADVEKARSTAPDVVLGAWSSIDGAAAKTLQEAGLDFVIIDPETTPASVLLNDALGFVLALPSSPEELFLRSLEPLSLEAVLLESVPSPLTVARQIELGRTGGLARKPMLCQVQPDASSEDLECLRSAGVVALLVAGAGVSRLKETVAALPPRRQHRDERTVVSLPRGQATPESDDDDE